MNRRVRVLALLLAGCMALSGCGTVPLHLREYPRQARQQSLPPRQTLTLVLPQDAPDSLVNMTYLLEAKLSELSGGQLSLEVRREENRLAMDSGSWDLAVFTNDDLIALDEDMMFLVAPFLFPDRESFLTILSQEDGPVLGSDGLREALGGSIVGLYYGGAVGLLCRSRLYDSLGFSYFNLGILDIASYGSAFYTTLPEMESRGVILSDQAGLLDQMNAEPLRYLEYPRNLELPEAYREEARYYEDTQHRFLGLWLALADGAGPQVERIVREAAAYTLDGQLADQLAEEDRVLGTLPPRHRDNEAGYPEIRSAARSLYRDDDLRTCVPDWVWKRISAYL